MNIDELERLSEAATDGPFEYVPGMRNPAYCPASVHSKEHGDKWPIEFHTPSMEDDAQLTTFLLTQRKTIVRMLRAGEKMETALNSSVYAMSNGCCQNNMTAYIRDADTALKEYQTAKESV